MLYTGIDYHKRYSVLCTEDAEGQRVHSARVLQNEPAAAGAEPDGAGGVLELGLAL